MTKSTNAFWHDRRVFVTGGTGFVGGWLIQDLLQLGARVVALVRHPEQQNQSRLGARMHSVQMVSGGVEDYAVLERVLRENHIDTVFHLAAQPIVGVAHRQPLPTFETNIRGTFNLLEACRVNNSHVKRIVLASSCNAYGQQERLPYTEEMSLQGRHPYEVSMSCASLLAQTYHHTFGLPVAVLRCGNVFGGGDLNWTRLVPYIIRSLFNHERPVIRSDGKSVRDYIYVQDISHCYLKVAEALELRSVHGEAFNFSLEQPVSVLELINAIRNLMGCQEIEPVIQNTATGEIHAQYLSAAKAHRLLDWQPQFTLEAGLRETIDWYARHLAGKQPA